MDGSTIFFAIGAVIVVVAGIAFLLWRRRDTSPSPEPARQDRLEANTITTDDLRAGTVSYGKAEARNVKTGRIEPSSRPRSPRVGDDDVVAAPIGWPYDGSVVDNSTPTPPSGASYPTPSYESDRPSSGWSDSGTRDHGGGWNSGASSDSGSSSGSSGSSGGDSGGSSGGGGGGGGGD